MIKKIIALILVPIVFMLTGELTSIKDIGSVQFNIETNNTITTDTYNSLLAYKDFKDFTLKRSLNITNEDIDKSRLKINDEVKNEIVNNELIENVSLIDLNNIEKITNNDKHFFPNFINSHNIKQLNQVYTDLNLLENVNTLNITGEKLADVTIYGKSSVKIKQNELDIANLKVNDTIKNELIYTNGQATISEKVGRKIFNGAENWVYDANNEGTTIRFLLNNAFNNNGVDLNDINNATSNLFNQLHNTNTSIESFMLRISNQGLYVRINTSKLLGYNVSLSSIEKQNLFKTYLTQNPLTVTYQLAVQNPKEKVIQDSDISLFQGTNVDYLLILKPIDGIFYNTSTYSYVSLLEGYIETTLSTEDISQIGKFSTKVNLTKIVIPITKGTYESEKLKVIGKKLTYQLTTPRYALTEGVQDTINPKIKSTSPTSQATEIQFNETLASIPNTSITDEIKPLANGQYEVTKKVKTVKLWEYPSNEIVLSATINNNIYRFQISNIVTNFGLKPSSITFINTFNYLVDYNIESRHHYLASLHSYLFIEKSLIDQQTGTTLIDKLKTYLQTNNIIFKGELANYEKYITTPTGNNLLELYPSGTVYTDSPIKLNYTDYTKPNSNINGNYSLFKNHLYYTGELTEGLFEINQTTKPVNTYEITNTTIKYDVITKKITLDINDSYNSIEISPNDNFKDLSGYELLNNNYELTYYIYQIHDPYIREFIKIVPMIYIGVVLIYILMFKERG